MVGWYHSGPKLRASDLEINELFKKYTPNPALVIIDVKPTDLEIPTDAYFAVEEIRDVSPRTTEDNAASLYFNWIYRSSTVHSGTNVNHLYIIVSL